MKRLWLLFAQSVTVLVAAYFVVATLQPSWLHRSASLSNSSAGIALIEAPSGNPMQPALGSFSTAARKASRLDGIRLVTAQHDRSLLQRAQRGSARRPHA